MTKYGITIKALASLIFALALCSTAQAQSRVFVSGLGSDANPCTRTAPCRTFQQAHNVVAAAGEVVVLDAAGYGQVTITKSVNIIGDGVYAGVTVPSGDGITINSATAEVALRNLTINGLGTGTNGINVTSVATLHVEGCVISGFGVLNGNGIRVNLTADGGHIFIKDTIVRNNGGDGIFITTSTGRVRASIDNCRSERNGSIGFFVFNDSRVTINRSVASGNPAGGFSATSAGSSSGATTEVSCEECVSSNNGQGFEVNALTGTSATIRVSHSTATNNIGNGFVALNTGVFESLKNNLVAGNGTDTSGTITVITAK